MSLHNIVTLDIEKSVRARTCLHRFAFTSHKKHRPEFRKCDDSRRFLNISSDEEVNKILLGRRITAKDNHVRVTNVTHENDTNILVLCTL